MKPWFKQITWVVMIIFSWQQFVWASPDVLNPRPQLNVRQMVDLNPTFDPLPDNTNHHQTLRGLLPVIGSVLFLTLPSRLSAQEANIDSFLTSLLASGILLAIISVAILVVIVTGLIMMYKPELIGFRSYGGNVIRKNANVVDEEEPEKEVLTLSEFVNNVIREVDEAGWKNEREWRGIVHQEILPRARRKVTNPGQAEWLRKRDIDRKIAPLDLRRTIIVFWDKENGYIRGVWLVSEGKDAYRVKKIPFRTRFWKRVESVELQKKAIDKMIEKIYRSGQGFEDEREQGLEKEIEFIEKLRSSYFEILVETSDLSNSAPDRPHVGRLGAGEAGGVLRAI